MILYLLDTNICSDLIKNPHGQTAQRLFEIGIQHVGINWVVEAELRFGAKLKNSAKLTERVENFINECLFLDISLNLAEHYADIRTQLTQQGQLIGANDLWIAAHARSTDMTLVTNNVREFNRVDGLKVENWL